uniref:Ig-like domain-containing protein n=1 Tax=Anas zonorhyncha TaxID=75864 RepID=A0A8B9VKH8_9AVES
MAGIPPVPLQSRFNLYKPRTCAGVGKLITQWPEETLKRAGETVDISCYQNNSHQLAYMFRTSLWLQKSYAEGYSEAKFEISRDNSELSVIAIKNVTRKDAATYFCAASDHTVS